MGGQVLYLEPVGGIAGDMFMAAAIDLGASPDALREALSGLALPPWRLEVTRAQRHSISGTHVDVVVDEGAAHGHDRALRDIRQMIDACATLTDAAKARAQRIFQIIGEAEARIHDVPLEEVHFHEVGAVDSIVDVCAAAVVMDLLGAQEVLALPPPVGSGMVKTAHGMMPVPAPATLEILKDVPIRFEGLGELTTPTGAGILKALAQIGTAPPLTVERVGYGVGTKDFRDRPNVLRASLARRVEAAPHDAEVWVIEANVDDCSPQLLGALIERMIEAGAHDAFVAPVTMKKSRPGHLFTAIAPGRLRDALAQLLVTESTTIGLRFYKTDRWMLDRRFDEVQTPFGKIRVKVASREGRVMHAQPEFEDCRAAAREHGAPVKDVIAEALAAWRTQRST